MKDDEISDILSEFDRRIREDLGGYDVCYPLAYKGRPEKRMIGVMVPDGALGYRYVYGKTLKKAIRAAKPFYEKKGEGE